VAYALPWIWVGVCAAAFAFAFAVAVAFCSALLWLFLYDLLFLVYTLGLGFAVYMVAPGYLHIAST
jgi:hypothetical protein